VKIKIPAYPNFEITESSIENIDSNTIEGTNSKPLSSKLIMISKTEDGERRVIRVRPVKHDNNIYISAFPNPVHLFLSAAVEHFKLSEDIKITNFPKCGRKMGDDIYLLENEENGTHTCYNNYMKYRTSSIVMLVSSLEAFLNHIIPNDFIYKTKRKNKDIEFNKIDIESPRISFREKLVEVIPQYLRNIELNPNLKIENKAILELYENRRNLIHLKTNAEDDFTAYFNEIDKMLEFDLNNSLEKAISFMNKVKPEFVKLEKH